MSRKRSCLRSLLSVDREPSLYRLHRRPFGNDAEGSAAALPRVFQRKESLSRCAILEDGLIVEGSCNGIGGPVVETGEGTDR